MKVKLKVIKYTFAKINAKRRRGQKIPTKWWIEGLPWEECGMVRCGPYSSYAEARSDCTGMQRIFNDMEWK